MFIGDRNLATEPTRVPHIVGDCEHVAFFLAGTTGERAFDEYMARGAGTVATAVTVNSGHAVIHRSRHQSIPGARLDLVFRTVKCNAGDRRHVFSSVLITFHPNRQVRVVHRDIRINAHRFADDFDDSEAFDYFLPGNAQLQFAEPVADAAMEAETE